MADNQENNPLLTPAPAEELPFELYPAAISVLAPAHPASDTIDITKPPVNPENTIRIDTPGPAYAPPAPEGTASTDKRPLFLKERTPLHNQGPTIEAAPEKNVWQRLARTVLQGTRFSDSVQPPKVGEEQFLTPEEMFTPEERAEHPAAYGAAKQLGKLTSVPLVLGGAAAGPLAEAIAPNLTSALFTGLMGKSLANQYPALKDASDRAMAAKTPEEHKRAWDDAQEIFGGMGVDTAVGLLAASHGVDAARNIIDQTTRSGVPDEASTLKTPKGGVPPAPAQLPEAAAQEAARMGTLVPKTRETIQTLQKLGYTNQQIDNFNAREIHWLVSRNVPATENPFAAAEVAPTTPEVAPKTAEVAPTPAEAKPGTAPEAKEAATPIKISTDTLGIKWAEDANGVRVSVPARIPEAEVPAYAADKIAEQTKLQADIKAKTESEPTTAAATIPQPISFESIGGMLRVAPDRRSPDSFGRGTGTFPDVVNATYAALRAEGHPVAEPEAPEEGGTISPKIESRKIQIPKENRGSDSDVLARGGWLLPDGQNYVHTNETHVGSAQNMGFREPARQAALNSGAVRVTYDTYSNRGNPTTLEVAGITSVNKPRLMDVLAIAPADQPVYIGYGRDLLAMVGKEFANPEEAIDWVDRQPTTSAPPEPQHEDTLARRDQMPNQSVNLSPAYGKTGKYVGGLVKSRLSTEEMNQAYTEALGGTEGTEPLEIPEHLMTKGGTTTQTIKHEFGHAIGALKAGLPLAGAIIQSHLDPTATGEAAAIKFPLEQIPGTIETPDGIFFPRPVLKKTAKSLFFAYMGGMAFDEHSGIPITENAGLASDNRQIEQLGRMLHMSPEALAKTKAAQLKEWRDIIKSNPDGMKLAEDAAGTREEGLSKTLHASAAKTLDVATKFMEAYNAGNAKRTATESGTGVSETQPGGAGENAERNLSGPNGGTVPGRAESRKEVKEPKTISDKLIDTYGTTDDPRDAGFILADGQMVPLKGEHNTMLEHLYEKYGDIGMDEAERTAFINNEKAIRVRFRTVRAGNEVVFSVPKSGVNPEQIEQIKRAVGAVGRNGRAVMEISEGQGASTQKDFVRVSDVDSMLHAIGAHPEPAISTRMENRKGPQVLPDTQLQKSAQKYAASQDMPEINHAHVAVDPEHAKQIAKIYDEAKHDPTDPRVKAAYDALKSETLAQFHHLRDDLGLKFEPTEKDPYSSAGEMMNDIRKNNRLKVFTGSGTGADHPLSAIAPGTGGQTYNTVFRWVHDAFGHAAGGNDFSESGEKSATEAHAQMYSDAARPAMRAETEGQTSWFFHNPEVEAGKAEPGKFAEQKATLLPDVSPDWHKTLAKKMETESAGAINPRTGAADTRVIPGKIEGGVEVYPESRERFKARPTPEQIQKFYDKNKDLFDQHPQLRVGWDEDKTNHPEAPWELNVGAAGTLAGATAVGKKLDQRAAWDIGKSEPIDTGGKNQQTSFPDYPLEQRLAELGKTKEGGTISPKMESRLPFPEEAPAKQLTGPAKGATTPLMQKPLTIEGTGPGGRVTLVDLSSALNKWSQAGLKPNNEIKAAFDRADAETQYQMARDNTGLDWYKSDTKDALDTLKQNGFPELEKPVNDKLFRVLWGITSYGVDPDMNTTSAAEAWKQYQKTGTVPLKADANTNWPGYSSIQGSITLLNKMLEEKGEQGTIDWLTSKHPIKEIREQKIKTHETPGVAGKADDEKYGAYIFGPKGGAYVLNHLGISDQTTVDIWGARLIRRWTGNLTPENIDTPVTPEESRQFDTVIRKIADKYSLDIRDAQAVLWTYEHDLYEAHGVGEQAKSYKGAAEKYVANQKAGTVKDFIQEQANLFSQRYEEARGKTKGSGKTSAPVRRAGPDAPVGDTQKLGRALSRRNKPAKE